MSAASLPAGAREPSAIELIEEAKPHVKGKT